MFENSISRMHLDTLALIKLKFPNLLLSVYHSDKKQSNKYSPYKKKKLELRYHELRIRSLSSSNFYFLLINLRDQVFVTSFHVRNFHQTNMWIQLSKAMLKWLDNQLKKQLSFDLNTMFFMLNLLFTRNGDKNDKIKNQRTAFSLKKRIQILNCID
ncbi:hypothetical protein BpHYR1_004001 [Brachionus plicatilis]|uniref:Uncharacterized protein n=1 Tax=Brachionus plicatilis TaxID=10195 RepID=A0A3M7T133_BRAPC|nr:hypothetical protein BpHYR1_004001 [Brachionus plicatilis]